MTRDSLHGYWLKATGTAKGLWGVLIADETLRIYGERDRWIGQMEIDASSLQVAPLIGSRRVSKGARVR